MTDRIQNYPVVDSDPTDAFEALVEAYFQMMGYITSSNKWFWVRERDKQQRGYQDIDLLAINGDETLLVSVTGNLDDKVHFDRGGHVSRKQLSALHRYFSRVERFLKTTPQYAWMVRKPRRIKRLVAFATGYGIARKLEPTLRDAKIEVISAAKILSGLREHTIEARKKGLRTNNRLLKVFQLLESPHTKQNWG